MVLSSDAVEARDRLSSAEAPESCAAAAAGSATVLGKKLPEASCWVAPDGKDGGMISIATSYIIPWACFRLIPDDQRIRACYPSRVENDLEREARSRAGDVDRQFPLISNLSNTSAPSTAVETAVRDFRALGSVTSGYLEAPEPFIAALQP